MKIIIPLAGRGERFINAGYTIPKPFIKIDKKRIIQYICDMFDKEDEIIFICNEDHLLQFSNVEEILYSISPNCKILSIPSHKKGPIFTITSSNAMDYINDEEEVIICYCDNPYLWNYNNFKQWVKNNNSDGCILSHSGFHPHRLSSTYMAYIKENNQTSEVLEIKEKEPYTNDPMTEFASTGTYYFNKGKYIKKYFQETIDKNIQYNGEYYVTLVYNLLIKDNLNIHHYPTQFVTVFGTPEEVENFQAWQTILNGVQVKNKDDLINCYQYWKSYNEARNS